MVIGQSDQSDPFTRGLFRNAISFGGSATNWWSHTVAPLDAAIKLAYLELECTEQLDCGDDDEDGEGCDELLECFEDVSVEDLAAAAAITNRQGVDTSVLRLPNLGNWSPRTDVERPEGEAFMAVHPWEAIQKV